MSGTTTNFGWPFPTNPDPALVAGDIQSLASAQDSTLGNAWTSYTPTWTGTTTNPVIGTGTIVGRYKQFGKWGICNGQITAGGTTTYGSGNYRFGLPPAWTMNNTPAVGLRGLVAFLDSSTSTSYVGYMIYATGTTLGARTHAATAEVGPTVPFTWATGDIAYWEIVVELT